MSFTLLRVENTEPHEYIDEHGNTQKAFIVDVKVRLEKRRTIREWLKGEPPKRSIEIVKYFTRGGNTWKDYPSLRKTDVLEWSRLHELFEQYQLKKSLKKTNGHT